MNLMHPSVISQASSGGIVARVVEFRWRPDMVIMRAEDNLTVQLRVRPRNLGVRVYATNNRKFELGALSVVPPERELYADTLDKSETVRAVTCAFEKNWLQEVVETPVIFDPLWSLQDADIQNAMSRMGAELIHPDTGNMLLIQCLATQVAILLERRVNDLRGVEDRRERNCLSPRQLKDLHEFVESCDGSATLAQVSDKSGLSAAYLQRMYKMTTGRTLYRLLEDVRMERAQTLLGHTDLPLKEVAHRLNFCRPGAFSTAFKKATGITPKAFRLRKGWDRLS